MVRRNKPRIGGSDPAYAHTFERTRPSDMPPGVKIPGIEGDKPETPGPSEPTAIKPVDPKPQKEEPKATARPKPRPKPKAPKAPKSEPKSKTGLQRQVTLDAAVKVDQAAAMQPLLDKGLQQRDIIMLAGRRTTERFTLSPTYIPKADADRLPISEGYHTSKRLDADTLDAMRDKHDPLRVRSDPAMVRGQFEALFWETLDEVITELSERFA